MVGWGNPIQGLTNADSSPYSYTSSENNGVYRHTQSRARSTSASYGITSPPHELKEVEDDTNRHSTYTSSETSDSSYQRSIYIDTAGNDIGSLL